MMKDMYNKVCFFMSRANNQSIKKIHEEINQKNTLRYDIKMKKRTLAKMANIPELADEYNALKEEIKELEKQL